MRPGLALILCLRLLFTLCTNFSLSEYLQLISCNFYIHLQIVFLFYYYNHDNRVSLICQRRFKKFHIRHMIYSYKKYFVVSVQIFAWVTIHARDIYERSLDNWQMFDNLFVLAILRIQAVISCIRMYVSWNVYHSFFLFMVSIIEKS